MVEKIQKIVASLEGVTKIYSPKDGESVKAVDNVSLDVYAGEMLAIMGPSGCGKSTALGILGLTKRPSRGIVYLDGEKAPEGANERAHLRNQFFGYVTQEYTAIDDVKVWKNIVIPMEYSGRRYSKNAMRERAAQVAHSVGIADLLERKAQELSGGQKQRVGIARALVLEPQVIIADEPTSALDSATASQVMDVLESLRHDGKAVVIATHDVSVAERCDRIVNLRDGRVVNSQ